MKHIILTILLAFSSQLSQAQSIFKGLTYGMSREEAKAEYKANKSDYKGVKIDPYLSYNMFVKNMGFNENEQLSMVFFSPWYNGGPIPTDKATHCLNTTMEFFASLGYEIFYEGENWNYPEIYNGDLGLVMKNSDGTTMILMYPDPYKKPDGEIQQSIRLEVWNHTEFMRIWDLQQAQKEKLKQESGF